MRKKLYYLTAIIIVAILIGSAFYVVTQSNNSNKPKEALIVIPTKPPTPTPTPMQAQIGSFNSTQNQVFDTYFISVSRNGARQINLFYSKGSGQATIVAMLVFLAENETLPDDSLSSGIATIHYHTSDFSDVVNSISARAIIQSGLTNIGFVTYQGPTGPNHNGIVVNSYPTPNPYG